LKYNLKSGRLKFEAMEKMIFKTRTQKKRAKVKLPSLSFRRPEIKEKTIESLEKQLSKFVLSFNKNNDKFSSIRLLAKKEWFNIIKKTTVYATSFCIMLVLIYGSIASLDLTFAKQVIANGTPVGIVKNAEAFEQKVEDFEEQLSQLSDGKEIDHAKLIFITRLCFEDDITSDKEIMQNLMSTYNETTKAYALYVNGEILCAVKSKEDLDAVLDEYKNKYDSGVEGETIGFAQDVQIKNEFVPIAYLCTKDGVYNAITATQEEEVCYTVKEKDTVWDIACKYGMSVDELIELNADKADVIKPGDSLKLNKSVPKLQVKVAFTETVDQSIPYENTRVNDSTMRKGTSAVAVQGSEGLKKVTQNVVVVNGERVACDVVSEEVVTEPVNGTIKVGTKIVTGVGTGRFGRPTSGSITARYGSRSSRWSSGSHTGLDFASSVGTPIYAADSGKVTFAGWKGSYGYMVILNHGNGYETYYAHCSKLCARVGQTVEKGELIAKVGSTGNSTGAHCHFEVRYNGVAKNPESYLK